MTSRRRASTFIVITALAALAGCQTPSSVAPAAKVLDVNGARLPYVEQGRGEPVVFVHGAISDHRTWDRQRAALGARGYRAISYTQRWFGTEPWGQDQPKPGWIKTHADDLAAFIRGLNAGPVHLVAWSHGGHIALNAAWKHPELVRSAFVFEPVVPSYVTNPEEMKALGDDRRAFAGPIVQAWQSGDNIKSAKLMLDGVGERAGYFETMPPAIQAIVLDNARTMPAMVGPDPGAPISCAEMAEIKPRVAIVRGAEVRPFFRIIADAAARCMPQAKHIVVPNQKHMWPAEDVAGFVEAVAGFIAGR